MSKDTIEFFKELKSNRPNLTVQQYRTIKGQELRAMSWTPERVCTRF
nr:MAG TPA: hypothetical protein [Caudoviricetes sp.]